MLHLMGIFLGRSGRVHEGGGKNLFPFLDLGLGLEGKEYTFVSFT